MMCNIADFNTLNHLADVVQSRLNPVVVRAVYLNPDVSGATCGLVFSSEVGYDTVLWVGDHTVRKGHLYHVWYEALFDEDGSLVAMSSFVRLEALDAQKSSLRTLVGSVAALTAIAHLRCKLCARQAGLYMVRGCTVPIRELVDLVR